MPEILPNWHPIVVHFAIALLMTSAVLFLLGALLAGREKGGTMTNAARWNLGIGVVAALFALATGWQAYNSVTHDTPSHANMTIHMKWAFAAVALFLVAAVLAWRDRLRASGVGAALGVALLLGCGALTATGWLGAENVYRYGLGVMSLPKAGHHHHHHDDDDADHDDHDATEGAAHTSGTNASDRAPKGSDGVSK